MIRAKSRPLLGVALAVGAPFGWLSIQALGGSSVREQLSERPGLYLYMLVGTAAAFGLFGLVLDERESRLLDINRRLEELAVNGQLTVAFRDVLAAIGLPS